MENKEIGIILCIKDYKKFYNQNKELIKELSISFSEIYIINLINLKLFSKKENVENENIFPPNFKCINFKNSFEFLKFFIKKNFVAIQFLSKNPDFFKIFFLIKLVKIKNVMIMNLSNFGNKQTPDFNRKNIFAFKHYYQKGFYYVFRILTIINIFPKIDLLFESNKEVITAINNGLSRKFEKKFPVFKISYFRNVELVNSIFYDQFTRQIKEESKSDRGYILYVDVPIDHGDRLLREGKVDKNEKINFYKNLRNFLRDFSTIFNLDVVVGLHPSSKDGFNFLSEFKISKQRTIDLIPNCEIALFTHSSLISSAVFYKKKILSINSKYLGDYISDLTNKYRNSLKLHSVSIDEKFYESRVSCENKMLSSINYYQEYIDKKLKPDGENLSNEKIVSKIKEYFF